MHRGAAAACAAILAVGIAACGSSEGGSNNDASPSEVAAGKQTAEAGIAEYFGKPSAFPVTEPLAKLPAGANIDFVDCGTPYCGLIYSLVDQAAQTMQVNLKRVVAGSSAASVSSAFDTVVADKPDAVIVTAINIELWKSQLAELQKNNTVIVTSGVTGGEQYGLKTPQGAEAWSKLSGKLMADYTAAKLGTESDVVVYQIPELTFTGTTADAYKAELATVCPNCSVRTVDIPVTTLGNSAPSAIVRDLQANPSTTVAIFTANDINTGLASAVSAAGIDIETIGNAPAPDGLQSIKQGQQTAGLGYDTAVTSWSLLDQAARGLADQQLSGPQAEGIPVIQFLTQPDITFDPAQGWTGYPDFVQRFKTLWGVK
jgi:ribose transport system substrate-binding protein